MNTILTEAIKAFVLGLIGVALKVTIQYGTTIACTTWKYLETKATEKNRSYVLTIAEDIWHRVEEDYRINDKVAITFNNKAKYFDSLLLAKFPSLTQNDLDELRQVVAGQINRYKNNWINGDTESKPTVDAPVQSEEVK